MKRLIVVLLILAMFVLAFSACGSQTDTPSGDKETGEKSTSGGNTAKESETEEQETKIEPNIPMKYTFEGEPSVDFLVWYHTAWEETVRMYRDIVSEDWTGDLVTDAVYVRNEDIKERYGVEITMDKFYLSEIPNKVMTQVNSGSMEYDVVYPRLCEVKSLVTGGYFQDLYKVPYIDLEKPWWDNDAVNSLTIADTLLLTATAINVNDKDATAALAFSKPACDEYNIPYFYNDVNNYTWTYAKLQEYCEQFGEDSTGDGQMDEDDFWGFLGKNDVMTAFFHGSGSQIVTKDGDEYFFTIGTERDINATDDIISFMNQPFFYNHHVTGIDDAEYTKLFESGHGLFFWMRLDEVTNMRGSDVQFGILPIPMYEEEQRQYYSTVSKHTTGLMSIPKTIEGDELDMVGMVLEALAAHSYYGLMDAYFTQSLQYKQASDEDSREMLEIIINSRVFDPGCVYQFGDSSKGFDSELQGLGAKKGSLSTLIAQMQEMTEKDIDNFMIAIGG